MLLFFFFFNDTATTEIYTLSLHDALPIYGSGERVEEVTDLPQGHAEALLDLAQGGVAYRRIPLKLGPRDRKSTRLNSSHANISYAVFCLKKKKKTNHKTA